MTLPARRWEKAIGTHTKPYWIRLPSRLPPALLIWFIGERLQRLAYCSCHSAGLVAQHSGFMRVQPGSKPTDVGELRAGVLFPFYSTGKLSKAEHAVRLPASCCAFLLASASAAVAAVLIATPAYWLINFPH